jgi:hypothetical protein
MTAESDEQREKHLSARNSTDAGIQMELKELQQQKALDPMNCTRDRGTNNTSSRER